MRNLPYVKFVDELYPNFDFHRISEYTKENENDMSNLGLIEPPVRYIVVQLSRQKSKTFIMN